MTDISWSSDFSSFSFCSEKHFSFIGKARFRRATLSCDSSYCTGNGSCKGPRYIGRKIPKTKTITCQWNNICLIFEMFKSTFHYMTWLSSHLSQISPDRPLDKVKYNCFISFYFSHQHMLYITISIHMLYITISIHMLYITISIHMLYITISIHMLYISNSIHALYITISIHMLYITFSIHMLYITISIHMLYIQYVSVCVHAYVCGGRGGGVSACTF